jgi:ABC-2 type transport system permease protein
MLLAVFVFTLILSYALLNRRDLGSSIFPDKPGPARADAGLLSAGGLAQRLQKGGLMIWIAAMAFTGIIVGVIGEEYRSLFEESDLFGDLLAASGATGSFTAIIFATMFGFMAPLAAGYIVSSLSKMQDEEGSGRIEYLMGTALGRVRWLISHLAYVVLGAVMIAAAMGISAMLSYYFVATETDVAASDIIFGSLLHVPALVLFMSVLVLLFSFKGRFMRTIAWTYFTYCALIPQLGVVFKWPQWVMNLSPFTHSPAAPSEAVNLNPVYVLSAVAIGLLLVSSFQFTRRDLVLK